MKGFIEITSDGVKSIIATWRIHGVNPIGDRAKPSGCESLDLNAIVSIGSGVEIWTDDTYEQIREALERAT